MARKKKSGGDDGPKGSPGWMTTYGDMMTLLLTFFVLLVSMSTTEIEKFKAAAASLKGALSVLPFQEKPIPQPFTPQIPRGSEMNQRRRSNAVARLRRMIRELNLSGVVSVQENPEGVHITVGDPALFDSGSAVIKSDFVPVLDAVVEVINIGSQTIRVEGHTDNVPIHTAQYDDNWELSIARALSVIRFIRAREVMDPRRLRPVGCGEFHPVASNDSPEGRARNRRVEIYIDL